MLALDPNKTYAELLLGTNIVARVFQGEDIPDWALQVERRIYEVPEGVSVQTGYVYANGTFRPPLTPQLIQERLEEAVQAHLDDKARERGYSNIFTAVTYADEPAVSQFQAEGQAYRAWRSQVWAYCYQALADVQQGLRPIPTAEELVAELPALVLP